MDKPRQIILFFTLIFLDQLSKFFFTNNNSSRNYGFSFGLGSAVPTVALVVMSSFLLLGLWILLKKQRLWHWSLVWFFAGGVSNLLDRLLFGAVRDFLPFFQLNNNLADYFIIGGLGIFIYRTIGGVKLKQK